jgi:hypothetical protein
VHELVGRHAGAKKDGEGCEECEGPSQGYLAVMVMPEMRCGEGQDSDGQQQADKGGRPDDTQGSAIKVSFICGLCGSSAGPYSGHHKGCRAGCGGSEEPSKTH